MPDSTPSQVSRKVGGGRFTLVKPLGRGGMGVVWLAQDERLNETVALKFLPSEIRGDAAALDDLRRETARSHKLSHPNIVRIHDLHEDADGTAFIVMEYINGQTLAALRLEQPARVLAWDYLRPLVAQLCAALEYAHGEKVIHRDLKPANIMVDSRGRLKLADFGIAAVASDSMSRISMRHSTSGTLPYMSPQQVTGKRPQAADDLYALGATLYELLTGKPPFHSGDITHQVLHEPPEPMDERLAASGMQNDIPPDAALLIMACLAKEPEQRPQSARMVAEWIGVEMVAKPSQESLAAAFFPQTPASPAEVAASEAAGNIRSVPSGNGRKWAMVGIVVLVAAGAFWLGKVIHDRDKSTVPVVAKVPAPAETEGTLKASSGLTPEMIWNKSFRFSWKSSNGSGKNGTATLRSDGTIFGIKSPNETYWLIDNEGHLTFKHRDGRISTIFTVAERRDGQWFFSGTFQFNKGVQHSLEEVVNAAATANWRSGLVLYFNFDEPPQNGAVFDQSGEHNDGQAVGVKWVVDGHRGGGAEFGPGGGRILVPNNDGLNPPQFTLAAWLKTTRKDAAWRRIFDKGSWNSAGVEEGYDLTMGGDDKGRSFRGGVFLEVSGRAPGTKSQVTDGAWHHVAGVFDGSILQLYLDGNMAATDHVTKPLAPTSYDLAIGNTCSGSANTSGFIGTMDDVMIFNRALSPEEITRLYESQK